MGFVGKTRGESTVERKGSCQNGDYKDVVFTSSRDWDEWQTAEMKFEKTRNPCASLPLAETKRSGSRERCVC